MKKIVISKMTQISTSKKQEKIENWIFLLYSYFQWRNVENISKLGQILIFMDFLVQKSSFWLSFEEWCGENAQKRLIKFYTGIPKVRSFFRK